MANKLMLVDDDTTLLRFLGEYLQKHDFIVTTASNGVDALKQAYRERPDLVILDVVIPGMDGWEVCARLRELSDFPIILLTAKASEADKLRGFRMGVDDYVTKPFSFAELTARVQAVLMRSQNARKADRQMYTIRDLVVDSEKRQAYLGTTPVMLTPTEFRLLECLVQKPGHTVTEEGIAQAVWGTYKQGDTAVVRRYIWLLRQKLEDDPANPKRLVTVRGFGYRLGTRPLKPAEAHLHPDNTDPRLPLGNEKLPDGAEPPSDAPPPSDDEPIGPTKPA